MCTSSIFLNHRLDGFLLSLYPGNSFFCHSGSVLVFIDFSEAVPALSILEIMSCYRG